MEPSPRPKLPASMQKAKRGLFRNSSAKRELKISPWSNWYEKNAFSSRHYALSNQTILHTSIFYLHRNRDWLSYYLWNVFICFLVFVASYHLILVLFPLWPIFPFRMTAQKFKNTHFLPEAVFFPFHFAYVLFEAKQVTHPGTQLWAKPIDIKGRVWELTGVPSGVI